MLQNCFCFVSVIWHEACEILIPQSEIKPTPPHAPTCIGRQNLDHWTTKNLTKNIIKKAKVVAIGWWKVPRMINRKHVSCNCQQRTRAQRKNCPPAQMHFQMHGLNIQMNDHTEDNLMCIFLYPKLIENKKPC